MLRPGSRIKIKDTNDNDNYKDWRGKILVVRGIFRNKEQHPGYDMGLYPMRLVECWDFPFCLYDFEFDVL